ncbi:hypothetical protein Taro_032669 [Colocasia esculenta]|uniref:Uncharacterized protein n=1 Tax=Colocasia esculenta TaxID=4460 RepID=A0A843WA48_COLES|nr:hypothetical protein [Colocasia esculenta]
MYIEKGEPLLAMGTTTTAPSPPPGACSATVEKSHLRKGRDELHNRSLVLTAMSRQSEVGHKVHNSNRHSLAGLRSHV